MSSVTQRTLTANPERRQWTVGIVLIALALFGAALMPRMDNLPRSDAAARCTDVFSQRHDEVARRWLHLGQRPADVGYRIAPSALEFRQGLWQGAFPVRVSADGQDQTYLFRCMTDGHRARFELVRSVPGQ